MSGHYWVHWTTGIGAPPNAVRGGTDCDGVAIYVGRAHHEDDLLPCKVMPDKNEAYVAYGGEERPVDECEIMCEYRLHWVASSNGDVPPGAVSVGRTADGEALYAGRVQHEGSQTVGKIHPSHQACYVSFDGREMTFKDYEVLVYSAHF